MNGVVVYTGIETERVLRAAEEEAEVIIWDGGNNDLPFVVRQSILLSQIRTGRAMRCATIQAKVDCAGQM